jgi:hypothetical protein
MHITSTDLEIEVLGLATIGLASLLLYKYLVKRWRDYCESRRDSIAY